MSGRRSAATVALSAAVAAAVAVAAAAAAAAVAAVAAAVAVIAVAAAMAKIPTQSELLVSWLLVSCLRCLLLLRSPERLLQQLRLWALQWRASVTLFNRVLQ